jgi:hypothetical protein
LRIFPVKSGTYIKKRLDKMKKTTNTKYLKKQLANKMTEAQKLQLAIAQISRERKAKPLRLWD